MENVDCILVNQNEAQHILRHSKYLLEEYLSIMFFIIFFQALEVKL